MASLTPKQKRSEETQAKLLGALNSCLEKKYFEHISITELAEGAGVSVGTFYRRFKDKNALLPLLYEQLGQQLLDWVAQLESQTFSKPEQAIVYLSQEMSQFIQQRQGVFRTLHLYTRLHVELVGKDKMSERVESFLPIIKWLSAQVLKPEMADKYQDKMQMWVFIIINTLIEKSLYQDITPASLCDMSTSVFIEHLSQAFINDLKELT